MDVGTSTPRRARGAAAPAVRVLFLHHSTGADLIRDGDLRRLLRERAPRIELWDYGYNLPRLRQRVRGLLRRPPLMPGHYYGLRDGAGRQVSAAWRLPGDNTDPDGWAEVFSQPVTDPPGNAFSHLLRFDVVAFKPCFTIFPLRSDEQLAAYQRHYQTIRAVMDQHPETLFIPMTPPPLRASLTTAEQAARAAAFARWMMSSAFHGDRANIAPFDLFAALAIPMGQPEAGTLRPSYCREDPGDSHPNPRAYREVATELATFLASTVEQATGLRSSATVREGAAAP